ncbi:MAG: hypothetical protein PHN64_04030 [Desulfovibrionaceae bacterium]|nr:hypothetical protein [Desulfovibrionaceae bacterium]
MEQLSGESIHADIKSVLSRAFEHAGYVASISNKRLLIAQEVEALYGISASSLEKMCSTSDGPEYIQFKQRGTVYYTQKALEEWINKNRFLFSTRRTS